MAPKQPRVDAHITKDSGILILLLGQAGAGKSSFINAAAGQTVADVNHSLISSELTVRDFVVQDPRSPRSLVFVDTPGFDHYEASDWEVLNEIVDWLKRSCHSDTPFGGIVYLHDITISRQMHVDVATMALRNLARPEPAGHLLMATVKWGRAQQDAKDELREQELRTNTWRKILDNGAHVCRFVNTEDSAWDIVNTLLEVEPLKLEVLRQELDRIHRLFPPRKPRFKKGFLAQLFGLFKVGTSRS